MFVSSGLDNFLERIRGVIHRILSIGLAKEGAETYELPPACDSHGAHQAFFDP